MKTTARKAILIAASLALILTLGFGSTWANEPDTTQNASFYVSVENTTANLRIIPGFTQANDTSVSLVNNNGGDCFLFVQITNNSGNLVTYELASGWEPLKGQNNVYFRTVSQKNETQTYRILNTVTYSPNITVSKMDDLNHALSFKAYMISNGDGTSQTLDVNTAWTQVPGSSTSTTTP